MVDARRRALRRRHPARRHGQDAQEPVARPVRRAPARAQLNPGALAGTLAFAWWGVFPLYFRLQPGAAPLEVLANRIVWSLVLLLAILAVRGRWSWLAQIVRAPRVLAAFVASSLLLSINWITYIWAVGHGHVIDASLGYFINPLVNVALGTIFLGETRSRPQWLALGLAALGVVWLAVGAGRPPWIGLILGFSFGAYGLLRKIAVLGALEGLSLETMILAPGAVVVMAMAWGGGPTSFPAPTAAVDAWLIGFGPATTVPLLLFAYAARRLSLTTLGLFQYLAPTLQFLLGLWLFNETVTPSRLAGFALIWAGLALYSVDGLRRRPQAATGSGAGAAVDGTGLGTAGADVRIR